MNGIWNVHYKLLDKNLKNNWRIRVMYKSYEYLLAEAHNIIRSVWEFILYHFFKQIQNI